MAIRKDTCLIAAPGLWLKSALRSAATGLLPLGLFFLFASAVSAQTSTQQFVYLSLPGSIANSPSSLISGFSQVSQTGALNSIPASPFSDRFEGGLASMDGQGKFLFVLNPTSNDISMFQIDQTTGTPTEVPGSPFAVPPTVNPNQAPSQPISITGEPSGQFLFVGYFSGDSMGNSAVVSMAINTSGSSPVLSTIQSVDIPSAPIQLIVDSKGLRLYAGLSAGPSGMAVGGAEVFSIDSSTGMLADVGTADTLSNSGLSSGLSYAIDPQDRFFYASGHDFLQSCQISPVDGTANTCSPPLSLNPGDAPAGLVAENSGQFVYAFLNTSDAVAVYSVDQTTGALTQALNPFSGIQFANGSTVVAPMGPYIYSAQFATPALIHAYLVDTQTGNLTEISGSPFSAGAPASCCGGLVISGSPIQAVSGPAATIFPSSAAPFSAVAGSSSPTQVFSIVNDGNQLLAINSISLTGTNASSFSQANTCQATLAPNANCSVSITFNPSSAGTFSADLQVTDNAPGSPQTLALNGTGIAPAPAVTLTPSTLSFPSTAQGASSAPQTLTVLSSGNATLNISRVSLSGANPSDFSFTNNCVSPLAPGASCTISVIFSPTASGQRTAGLMIADDAPGSPQTATLSGTGIGLVPALTLSPPVPSFPATTQGTSSAPQTLTAVNSGNAPLQISSVAISGSNASEFSLTSNCTALAPAASCAISLVFSPTASGQGAATLMITDDAPGSPQTVSVSATANPAFAVTAASGSSTSASVSAGQTANYQLQLTPGSGFNGAVALSCTGAPLGAACQVPATVSFSSGAVAMVTVTVTTSGPASFPPSAPFTFPPSRVPLLSPFALAMLLLLFLRFAKNRYELVRVRTPLTLCAVLVATFLCVTLAFAGCGGGSAAVTTTPPQPIVTPSGTSTITINLSANSSSGQPLQLQPIQLTLIVN